jgi:hypothetical protein
MHPAAQAAAPARRVFVTDAIRSGLPPRIAAKVCGHSTVDITVRYAAIYPEDVIAHHRAFVARRGTQWLLAHPVELREVALGTCGRDQGTPCAHENACFSELGWLGSECQQMHAFTASRMSWGSVTTEAGTLMPRGMQLLPLAAHRRRCRSACRRCWLAMRRRLLASCP